jgi:hypothetical protein
MIRRGRLLGALLLCLVAGAIVVPVRAQADPPASVSDRAFAAMSAPLMQDALVVAGQLDKWRADYARIQKALKQAEAKLGPGKSLAPDAPEQVQLATWAQQVTASLAKQSPELRDFLNLKDPHLSRKL